MIARREFFANRAAAQAVKARVESYERGGNILTGGNAAAPSVYEQQQAVVSVPSSNYNNNARRYSSDGNTPPYGVDSSNADYDPEARIAHLKAQRERERERENAQKELEVTNNPPDAIKLI